MTQYHEYRQPRLRACVPMSTRLTERMTFNLSWMTKAANSIVAQTVKRENALQITIEVVWHFPLIIFFLGSIRMQCSNSQSTFSLTEIAFLPAPTANPNPRHEGRSGRSESQTPSLNARA